MHQFHKKPQELSYEELEEISELIFLGGENPKNKILEVLKNAYLISYVIDDDKIVSTTTIKRASVERRKLIFDKTDFDYKEFLFELGFWVTLPEYHGKQIALNLFKNQLIIFKGGFKNNQVKYPKLFCLIYNKQMINIFERVFEFQNSGKKIFSTYNDTVFYLMIK